MNKRIKIFANLNIAIGMVLIMAPILVLLYYIFIGSAQNVSAFDPDKENDIIVQPIFDDKAKLSFKDPFGDLDGEVEPLKFVVPNYEATDIGTRIRIDSIGLKTTVYESKNPTFGLNAGVWRDPLYGVPDRKNTGPIILAAHRWGEDTYSWEYRYENLFTKFDQLKVGDEVKLTWNQKEYKYVIRKVEEGTSVNDSGDLIMYTCIYYNSPERIFVYADLVR